MKTGFILFFILLLVPSEAQETSDQKHIAALAKPDKVDAAVKKGIDWLITKKQNPENGSLEGKHPVTYTALTCMALMANGHFSPQSPYGSHLEKGIQFILRSSEENRGYLGNDGGRMYGHGIATLSLIEAYGMMNDPELNREIHDALEKAIAIIVNAQVQQKNQHRGGWRYEATSRDADLSVSAWQILALRAAQNCQFSIPKQTIPQAISYVRRCYHKQKKAFTYQGNNDTTSMKAAGVVSLLALGAPQNNIDQKMIRSSADAFLKADVSNGKYFYYQTYYLITAANMLEDKYSRQMSPKITNTLLELQLPHGEFKNHTGYDSGVYPTAFAIICLSVRQQYLPIYQE